LRTAKAALLKSRHTSALLSALTSARSRRIVTAERNLSKGSISGFYELIIGGLIPQSSSSCFGSSGVVGCLGSFGSSGGLCTSGVVGTLLALSTIVIRWNLKQRTTRFTPIDIGQSVGSVTRAGSWCLVITASAAQLSTSFVTMISIGATFPRSPAGMV
jgi:hypothetical protein